MSTIVLLSGGLDSTVLLHHTMSRWGPVRALSVDYGQRHRRELDAARAVAAHAGVEHRVIDLSAVRPLLAGSSQTDPTVAIPDGHYADPAMRVTVVPNRNMVLLALAASWAISTGSHRVAYAAHAGDHPIYPDCRPEFIAALGAALALADYKPVEMVTPFKTWSKADVVREGARLGVPFYLTWSCYKGDDQHCGLCGTCVERREAFQLAGVADPTEYSK